MRIVRTIPGSAKRVRYAAGVACALLSLAGCGAPGGKPAPAVAETSPGAMNVGIETRLWTIDATLGAFLVELETESLSGTGLAAADRELWRDAGFRLIEVPADRIDRLEESAPQAEAVRHVWLGQPTKWTPIASREATAGERRTIPGSAGSSLQLLARSWIEPDVRRGPVFRVELAVARTYRVNAYRDGAGRSRPELVDGMLLSHTLEPGRALLLVPASPGEVWAEPVPVGEDDPSPGPSPDAATGESALEIARLSLPPEAVGARANSGRPVDPEGPVEAGPAPPVFEPGRSIGVSLLLRPALLGGPVPVPARRTVVVIVPHWSRLGEG